MCVRLPALAKEHPFGPLHWEVGRSSLAASKLTTESQSCPRLDPSAELGLEKVGRKIKEGKIGKSERSRDEEGREEVG